jgi:dolichyl-phosphate beta-glucosyltransferase
LPQVSIVIPAYNEEKRLPSTLDAILKYRDASSLDVAEILVVDDGSTDQTVACVAEYTERHPEIRVLQNPGNRGKGFAVKNGMLEAHSEWILSTDADLSAPIEEAAKLLAAATRNRADIVIGSRALDRSLVGVHQSLSREYAGRVFNALVRVLTGLPFADTQCGFKLFRRSAAKAVFGRQQLDGFGFDVEDLFIASRLGLVAIEVPVRWNNVEGSKVSLASGMNSFLDLIRIRWYQLAGRYR